MSIQADVPLAAPKAPPISKEVFLSKAQPEKVTLFDEVLYVVPKTFATGSYGWACNDRMTMVVDGKPVTVFVNLNLTVAGSKPTTPTAPTPKTPPAPTLPGESPTVRRGMK